MRASKENAEKAIQTLTKFEAKIRRALRHVGGDNIANKAVVSRYRNELMEFLKAAKAKLPTEAAFDRESQRKRAVRNTVS